jgi:GNAT superfamily N-acetyltransferase
MKGLHFDTANLKDVETALIWAAQEGWNPGLQDAQAFLAADPNGFFVARVADEIIAAISVVNHNDTMAFLGLYLCKPEFRGKGVGFALWRHALHHAGKRCVGLDGVAEQEPNYAKSGFVRTGATTRLQGKAPRGATNGTRAFEAARDFAAIVALDQCANGYDRPRFLAEWVSEHYPTRKTVVYRRNGEVSGFATIRLCQQGAKAGPVTAPDTTTALILLSAAAASLDVADVTLDLPSSATAFRKALEGRGFVETFETARMYCGAVPQSSPSSMAIATMELG